MTTKTTIGVISDTHGLLRESAINAFEGVDQIIHAGDVGSLEVVERLERIGPVAVVRGNHDRQEWASDWPLTEIVLVENFIFYVIHSLAELDLDPRTAGCRAVISGHTHCAESKSENGILFLSPGCAGPAQRDFPNSVALIEVTGNDVESRIVEIAN